MKIIDIKDKRLRQLALSESLRQLTYSTFEKTFYDNCLGSFIPQYSIMGFEFWDKVKKGEIKEYNLNKHLFYYSIYEKKIWNLQSEIPVCLESNRLATLREVYIFYKLQQFDEYEKIGKNQQEDLLVKVLKNELVKNPGKDLLWIISYSLEHILYQLIPGKNPSKKYTYMTNNYPKQFKKEKENMETKTFKIGEKVKIVAVGNLFNGLKGVVKSFRNENLFTKIVYNKELIEDHRKNIQSTEEEQDSIEKPKEKDSIINKIETFEDALNIFGVYEAIRLFGNDGISYTPFQNDFNKSIFKLRVLSNVLNQGWKPDFKNNYEERYFVDYANGKGGVLIFLGNSSNPGTALPNRVFEFCYFKSKESALHAIKICQRDYLTVFDILTLIKNLI